MTHVVIYGCLSDKAEDDGSIPSQVAKVRERLAQVYPEGVEIVGVFTDDGFSGSKRNRGPGLEAAIATSVRTADEHGACELWANTSARFGRGSGRKAEARSLLELFTAMRRAGVTLRSVHDDEFISNELLIGFASAQASKYADDLSESVSRAKRRQAERGQHLGGPLPIGYCKLDGVVVTDAGLPTVERIFALAQQGVPDGQLARTVNGEGHRTRAGRPFDRRSIQAIVTNAFYSGRIAYEGEMFDGKHPAIVLPEVFDAIQCQRPVRDLGEGRHETGRPARRHLLSRLAVCAECGSPMFCHTSPYKRKDGTKARSYRCRAYWFSDGTCTAKPVDAEAIDTAVMERLHDLLPDFEAWIEQIEDRHSDERGRFADLAQQAEADRDRAAEGVERHERRYRDLVARDDAHADLALEFVAQARRDLADAETRLQATRDALASIPTEAPRDRLLDFAIDLRESIAGKAAKARSAEEVNRVLVEHFGSFAIARGDWLPDDEGLHARRGEHICIEPDLRPEVAAALIARRDPWPAPPMAWIEAVGTPSTSGITRSSDRGLALPPIYVGEYVRTITVEPVEDPVPPSEAVGR